MASLMKCDTELIRAYNAVEVLLWLKSSYLIHKFLLIYTIDNVSSVTHLERTLNLRNIIELAANHKTFLVLFGIALYGVGYGILLTTIPAYLLSI